MKQRLDKEERLAQHADAQALARRSFLQRAAGLATVTAMAPAAFARNFGANTEPQRYPDPDIIALDKRFKYKLGNTPVQRLYTGTL
jgi:gluconolactonase